MPPNQDSSSVRKRAHLDSVDARQSKSRRTTHSAPSRPVVSESSADSLLNDGADNDGFVFVGAQGPAGFGTAPLLGQSLFLPGTDDEVTTVDPALLGHADVHPANNTQPSDASAAASLTIPAIAPGSPGPTLATAAPAVIGHAEVHPVDNTQPSNAGAAVSLSTPAIASGSLVPTLTTTAPATAAGSIGPTLAAAAPASTQSSAAPAVSPNATVDPVAPAATANANNATVLPPAPGTDHALAPAVNANAENAIVLPQAPASVAITVPVTSRPSLMAAALVGLGSTRLEHCNDVLVGRITGIHRWKEEDRFRFPLWDVPPDANWGPPLPFDKPDEILCAANTASALKLHFVAELSRYVLADRDGSALDQVSVNVVPMAARVRSAAETQVQQLSTPSTTVPVSYWGPGQIRARTWTSTYGKAPYGCNSGS